jgi:hypothetical protein
MDIKAGIYLYSLFLACPYTVYLLGACRLCDYVRGYKFFLKAWYIIIAKKSKGRRGEVEI